MKRRIHTFNKHMTPAKVLVYGDTLNLGELDDINQRATLTSFPTPAFLPH